jgi:hypothetical protein
MGRERCLCNSHLFQSLALRSALLYRDMGIGGRDWIINFYLMNEMNQIKIGALAKR